MVTDMKTDKKENEKGESWKEGIRAAITALLKDKTRSISAASIEHVTGITADRIRKFVTDGYLGTDDVRKLEVFLNDNGVGRAAKAKKTPKQILAEEMHNVADYIGSPDIDDEMQVQRFLSAVRGWNAAAEKYEAMFRKKSN